MASFYQGAFGFSNEQQSGNGACENEAEQQGRSGASSNDHQQNSEAGGWQTWSNTWGDSTWDSWSGSGHAGGQRWWHHSERESEGQWYHTPQGWVWGTDLNSAVEYGIRKGWFNVDHAFCMWWGSESSSSAGGSREPRNSSDAGAEWGAAAERNEAEEFGGTARDGGNSMKEWSGPKSSSEGNDKERKPNMGKDYIPSHDGTLTMREYSRRAKLFQATTSIDSEYQAGRLVEKLQG